MQSIQTVSENTIYVGASDRRLAKFENLFPIPRGVSYNAYVILDEKTALLDTADASVGAQFLENVAAALDGRKLDYLIVDHMEPDHAAMIEAVLVRWPDLRLVVNAKTLPMLKMYFPTDSAAIDDALVVKEGDTLDLGKHKLTFVMAPMVHWPEVMMTFDTTTGTLFSADAFGTFGALEGALFADEVDFAGKWPRLAPNMIIIIIGILFIIPGIVTLINYWIRKSKEGMKLPSYILIESTGSILLGLCMALIPEFFTAFFMYCLGFLLVLGGITQIISLVNIQRNIPISLYYYITPILILIAGIITVLNPFETQDAILIMFGICAIIYGITELVNYYKLK